MRSALVALSSLLLLACGDDTTSAGGDGGTGTSTSGDPTTTGGVTTSTTDDGADGTTTDEADASSTVEVPGEDYNTRVISGRRTLVRGFWSLHANFEPREILGRLTVDYPDGTRLEQDFVQFVDGESSDGAGSSSFQWLLEPDQVVPGMTYRVRLFEMPGSEASGELSDPPPIAPLAGPGTLELYDVPLQLKVVLVPIQHEFEGCTMTPDITEDDVQALREQLEQNNPVQEALFEVREPMVYTETIGDGGGFSPILAALAQTRAADNPAPNVYYYGLMDPCDGYPPGLLGQAIAIAGPPTMENGQERISTGRWNGSGAAAAETFVHEVGHTQGRRHVRCSGGEAGIDAAYPHAGGRIGVWGFGIYDFELRSPSGGRDYMTYCSNEWVSDYSWEQTMDVIEVLTSFDAADASPSQSVVLAGLIHEDGSADWWTQPGTVEDASLHAHARFSLTTGPIDMPARIRPVPHGTNARYVEIPLSSELRSASAVDLVAPGVAQHVELADVVVIR